MLIPSLFFVGWLLLFLTRTNYEAKWHWNEQVTKKNKKFF